MVDVTVTTVQFIHERMSAAEIKVEKDMEGNNALCKLQFPSIVCDTYTSGCHEYNVNLKNLLN